MEDKRCSECGVKMFGIPYKHNGEPKIQWRCAHPHGMSGRRDFPLDPVAEIAVEFEDEHPVFGSR